MYDDFNFENSFNCEKNCDKGGGARAQSTWKLPSFEKQS